MVKRHLLVSLLRHSPHTFVNLLSEKCRNVTRIVYNARENVNATMPLNSDSENIGVIEVIFIIINFKAHVRAIVEETHEMQLA